MQRVNYRRLVEKTLRGESISPDTQRLDQLESIGFEWSTSRHGKTKEVNRSIDKVFQVKISTSPVLHRQQQIKNGIWFSMCNHLVNYREKYGVRNIVSFPRFFQDKGSILIVFFWLKILYFRIAWYLHIILEIQNLGNGWQISG